MTQQVNIPNASNISSGFDNSHAWTFFDLNKIYDEHKEDPVTVVQADFVSTGFLFWIKFYFSFIGPNFPIS